jgi:hypothetical protein
VLLAGTDDVVLGPTDLASAEGTATIVSAIGSAEGSSLMVASQVIDVRSPSGQGVVAPPFMGGSLAHSA